MAKAILIDEVLEELGRLERQTAGGPAGFTSREVAYAMKTSLKVTRDRIREWYDRGLIAFAGKRQERNISGGSLRVPVYRLARSQCCRGRKKH